MSDNLESAIAGAMIELRRQADEHGAFAPYISFGYGDEDGDPTEVIIDGRIDLSSVILAALKATDNA